MFITFVIHRSNTLYSFNQVLLDPIEIKDSGKSYGTRFVNETKNHWGGVTKTNVIYFGDEYDGNLIVVEQKRKRGVEKSGAVRVAHYYAIFNENILLRDRGFPSCKVDAGLSVEVVITVGPSEHPSKKRNCFKCFNKYLQQGFGSGRHALIVVVVTERRQHYSENRQLVEIEPETETETETENEEGINNCNVFAKYLNIFRFGSTKERGRYFNGINGWKKKLRNRKEGIDFNKGKV
ncbi:hypothetical protein MtrunA17_Chr6g0486131 [Medicago truncatula]|nr:hypothetical protein MtrunA17_Chr6g0486131 [Medicago truncatula]